MLIKWIKIETNSPLEKGTTILEGEVSLKLTINFYSPVNENLKLYNINNNVLIPIFSKQTIPDLQAYFMVMKRNKGINNKAYVVLFAVFYNIIQSFIATLL